MIKKVTKARQPVPIQPIQADKRPYLVVGMPRTVLYLNGAQAAKRFDLIPQFLRMPLELYTTPENGGLC